MIAKKALVASLFFILLFLTPGVAIAQETTPTRLDLTVSPPVMELVAKPGDTIQETFRIRNNTNESMVLAVSARRLISDPQNGSPIPEVEATGEELKWITFDKNEFTARPQEWEDIAVTIAIPESAAYGYYYVFRITPKNFDATTATGASLKGELLVVALLNVKKEGAKSTSELVSFKANNMISEYLPVTFTTELKNTGNVHSKPRGNIFISRGGGEEISILEVNSGLGSILPGGTREFETSWSDGFLVREPIMQGDQPVLGDDGLPKTKLAINWNQLTDLRFGPYTARLLMVFDDGTKDVTIEGATTFWVIPYTAIAIVIITIIILIVFVRFLLKMYIKKALKNSRGK